MHDEIFQKIIKEICNDLNITFESMSDNWISKLTKNNNTHFIIGKHFDLNSATSGLIANDKVATSQILEQAKIPVIPHYLIYYYPEIFNTSDYKNQKQQLLSSQSYPLVIKPNQGSQGKNVHLCKTPEEASKLIDTLLPQETSLAICPFFPAQFEYRCFFLNNKIQLIYRKNRQNNEWRHNLSRGAKPQIIEQNSFLFNQLSNLAIKAGKVIGINFATIDILESESTKELKVLEINQGVCASLFAQFSRENYLHAKKIYTEAIKSMFKI